MQQQQGKPGQQNPSGRQDRPSTGQPKDDGRSQGGPAGKSQHGRAIGPEDDAVGKDTDNDGRVVKPGHKPGEVDGGSKNR